MTGRARRTLGRGRLALAAAVLTLPLATACGDSTRSGEGPSSSPSPAVQQITSDRFAVQIPAGWEEYDLSNQSYVNPSRPDPDVRRHFGTPRGEGGKNRSEAFLSYISYPGPPEGTEVPIRKLVEGMDAAQQNLESDEVRQSYVSMQGHGCLDGYESLGEVRRTSGYGETGQLTGVGFEYRCLNSGMPMRGYALAAYSDDARRHDVFLTAEHSYWEAHEEELNAVIESISGG